MTNKTMKPSQAPARPQPRTLTPEEQKEQRFRAYMQKKGSLAEGILFNLCQNPNLTAICEAERKNAVELANNLATGFMKEVYLLDVVEQPATEDKANE